MSLKHSFYVFLALLFLISSLGLVCASENVSDSTSDLYGISENEISYYENFDLTNDNDYFSTNQEENFTNINKNSNYLLGISNNEDILGGSVIPFDGNYFNDLRIAIDNASNGDIIDLEGKTIITVVNGNPKLQTDKNLTFINGVLDAQYAGPISIANRNFITNCHFENITFKNYNAACMYPNFFRNCTLKHVSFENFTLAVAGFVFRNSNLYDVNFTNCHSLEKENPDDYEYAAMAVVYNSVIDNCNFVNCTTNRHSGAICVAGENGNRVDIFNSNFINCSAGIGGAIYVHGNRAINENYHSNIINCTFIGNTATERGGAIGSSQNYLIVENCIFENNTAKQGAAYMLAGIDHGLDGIREGHYNTMINCYFKNNTGTEEGGAVHITGNNNRAINCTFDSNFATNGNGSAVYIHGENASIIDSEFYNHECSRGTVYIIGNNSFINNSTFENNTASRGGAGIYVEGDNTLVTNSVFNSNNATIHGGAIHAHGDNIKILNTNFTSNSAIASTENLQQGLGGAVFITGDNSLISKSNFINNVARNGSAIYNRGENLTISQDTFFENQAWSYLLTNIASFKRIYYDPEKNVTINVTFKGGDNIINAIHNDGSPSEVFFYNVTYELSIDKNRNTGLAVINPVDGVENSDGGRLLYQDPREDLQNVTIIVTHLETGKVVINYTGQTGILGNISVSRKGLLPGNYSVNVTHYEDGLYKFITNMTFFEILPIADLAVEKTVSNKAPSLGDEIIWTIKVTNNGPLNVSDAYVIDKLPTGLIFKGSDGDYNSNSGIWNIGVLNVGDIAVLNIRTVVNISNSTITNVATVNSSVYDPNEENNVANNTTKSNPLCDLSVVKLVSKETSVMGETITWTIIVTNKGPDTALNAYAIDILPSTLTYVADDSKGKYNHTTGIWNIGNLNKDATAILNIKTIINKDNTTIINNVFVNSTTPDSNKTNNNASNKTNVLDSNFDVEKITLTPLVNVGDQVTFQIVVKNSGLTTLHNVFVEESQYDGLIFDRSLYQSHWDYSKVAGKNRWTLNTELGVGQVVVLSVVFNTTKEGNFTNVIVAGSDETENKTAHNNTTVVNPSFTVEKISLNPLVTVGEQVVFEIVVTNTGKLGLTDVFVEELSYDGLVFDHAYGLGHWNEVANNKWVYNGVLAPNQAHGFFVVFNTTKEGNFTNVVVAGSKNSENKTSNNTTNVVKPSFTVEKISLTPLVSVGEQAIFEIVVTNTGIVDLTNVFVEELSYDGLVFDQTYGTYYWTRVANNKWLFNGVISPNESQNFFVVFNTTREGNFTNVVVAGSKNSENKTSNNTTNVVKPSFTVEKISLTPLVSVGEQAVFEIVVTNTGKLGLTDVFVEELSYDGLVFDHAYGLGHWNEVANNKWVYNGVLAPNQAHGFFVVFNTTREGNFTNVVVAGSKNSDNKTTNDTVEVISPSFTVEKITLTPVVKVGEKTTFEIVVKNVGKIPLNNLFIEELYFDGLIYDLEYASSDYLAFNFNSTKPKWQLIRTLNPNAVVSLFVTFNTDKVGNFTNIVSVGADGVDNKTANNITQVLDDPKPLPNGTDPDISIEKIALNKIVSLGNQVEYEIIVKNIGNKTLNNVTVKELNFIGLEFDHMFDYSGMWIDNGDLSWTFSSPLYKGETSVFYVIFNTIDVGNFTNCIVVSSDETPNKTSNETIEVLKPEIEVNKVTINKTIAVGDETVFEILVRNTGKIAVNNILVNETSFDGLNYVGWYDDSGLWTYNGDLTWSLNYPLYPKEYVGFFVRFNASDVGKFTNVIVVSSSETPNKTANDTVDVLISDLIVEKVANNKLIPIGENAVFEIFIRNTGKIAVNNILVNETSFDGLNYVDWYGDTDLWTYNGDLTWSLNFPLYPNEYVSFFVRFNARDVGKFTNVVVVSSSQIPNKTANDTLEVVKPMFDIEKIALNKTVFIGEQVIFEILVENTGKTVLDNVTINENSFDGLTFAGWYDDSGLWTYNGDLTWTLNNYIYPSEKIGFFVIFDTAKEGIFTNAIVGSSKDVPNKTANDTVTVLKPDFSIEKVTVNRTVLEGNQVIFQIIVSNTGNVDLYNVTVYEDSFDGLTYSGWYDYTNRWVKNDDLSWSFNYTLFAGKYADFFVVFNTTKEGNFTNVVVGSSDKTENKTANDTVEIIPACDLSINKAVSNPYSKYGDVISWTITVVNNGPSAARAVYVVDQLAEGLIYQSYDASIGSYNPITGIWTIGDLPSGYNASLSINTLVNITYGKIINVAIVDSSTPDKNMSNNIDNDTTILDSCADLEIVKVLYKTEGNVITWGIYIVNHGPDTAINTRVFDILPDTLKYLNSYVSIGSFDSESGIWTIGDMLNGQNEVMILETLALTNGLIINNAFVVSDTQDPNISNNYDFDVVIVEDVDPGNSPGSSHVNVLPSAGNPLIAILLALISLGTVALRRKK